MRSLNFVVEAIVVVGASVVSSINALYSPFHLLNFIMGIKSCASAWLEHYNESVPEFVK